jgi:hypothetical protein
MVPNLLFVGRQLDTGHTYVLVLDLDAGTPDVAGVQAVQ